MSENNDGEFLLIAKAVIYVIVLGTAVFALARLGVSPLLGSRSDMGMVGAVAVGCLGILGIAYLARAMFRDLRKSLNAE